MKNLMLANHSCLESGNTNTETSRQLLGKQLARAIAFNLTCLFVFIVLCAVMTFGSISLLLTWQ
jgi:hypothetical protein